MRLEHPETMDSYYPTIKAIPHRGGVYLLDIQGNVSEYVMHSFCNAVQKFENCTDIFATDALYARQFLVNSEGKLVN